MCCGFSAEELFRLPSLGEGLGVGFWGCFFVALLLPCCCLVVVFLVVSLPFAQYSCNKNLLFLQNFGRLAKKLYLCTQI